MFCSLGPHGLQHAGLVCPSLSPRVWSNLHPSTRRCHPTISSSVIPFSSRLQSFSASGSFPMSQLFPSVGQSIGVSASTPVLPMDTQDWSPLGWTGWISLQPKGLSRVPADSTTIWSISSLALTLLHGPTPVHDYWKNHSFYRYLRKGIEMAPRLWPVPTAKMKKPLIAKHKIEG